MYYRQRAHRRQQRSSGYFMPFLIILGVGVIAVLLFNLGAAVFGGSDSKGAYMHIVEGSVEMRTWGTEDFFALSSDALVLQGDELKTSEGAKVIIEFFDGTIMRVDGGSDVVFEEMNSDDGEAMLTLMLVDGRIWFNKIYKDTGATEISVKMDDATINSDMATVFEAENEFEEVVRVIHGDELTVDIFTEDNEKVVETETVGIGQEIVFSENVLQSYWQYKSPSVLTAVSDEFKLSDFYLWNIKEDKKPTEFVKITDEGGEFVQVKPEVIEEEVVEEEVLPEEGDEEVEVEDKKEEEKPTVSTLKKPVISSVNGSATPNANCFYVVADRLATLTGTVSGADKIVVNGYTLQKFTPGSTSWTYFANADFGLMREGENIYEIYAIDSTGKKSEVLTVKVLHQPKKAEPAPAPTVEEEKKEEVPAEVPAE